MIIDSLSNADKGTTHGDIAIAACCGFLGVKDAPKFEEVKTNFETPRETPQWRYEERERHARNEADEFVFG